MKNMLIDATWALDSL